MRKLMGRLKESLYGILFWVLLLGVPLLLIISEITGHICSNTNKTDSKDYQNYDTDYEKGLSIGYESGYNDGHSNGYDIGYNDGSSDGYDNGYSDGELDGYHVGATYTCLFYGDVDRAFKSAKTGAAWYTFVDAYDEYIADIYDDDDARLDIIWALISATIGNDATEEETELLKSTFGEELFSNNGIILSP